MAANLRIRRRLANPSATDVESIARLNEVLAPNRPLTGIGQGRFAGSRTPSDVLLIDRREGKLRAWTPKSVGAAR